MGTCSSSLFSTTNSSSDIIISNSSNSCIPFYKSSSHNTIPLSIQIAHFTPSSFPLIPFFNKNTIKICKKSWEILLKTTYKSLQTGLNTSSITVFYNEFYQRLYKLDNKHEIDKILTNNCRGGSNIAAKGAIIVRIVKFALSLENNAENIKKIRKLGKSHSRMGIRGWQYSMFIEILLITISSQLGSYATFDVMSCWVNLFAFILQHMLPTALEGNVTPYELNTAEHSPEHAQRDQDQHAALAELDVVCTSHSKKSGLQSLKEDLVDDDDDDDIHNLDKVKEYNTNNTNHTNNTNNYNSIATDQLSTSLTWTTRNSTSVAPSGSKGSLDITTSAVAAAAIMATRFRSHSSPSNSSLSATTAITTTTTNTTASSASSASSLNSNFTSTLGSGKNRRFSNPKKTNAIDMNLSIIDQDLSSNYLEPVAETPSYRAGRSSDRARNQGEGHYLQSKSDGDNHSISVEEY